VRPVTWDLNVGAVTHKSLLLFISRVSGTSKG
jgi:hypothetical protein